MTSIVIDRNDGLSSSTAVKGPCRAATIANITLSGLQTIDGVALAEGDRVLVVEQTDAVENGIYVADIGPWRRAKDFSGNRDVRKGTLVYVTDGTLHANDQYIVTSENPIIIGESAITLTPTVATEESLPTTAARYIRRNAAGTDFEALTAQQSANLDTLRDIVPGSVGQALLASALASAVWSVLGITPDANLPDRVKPEGVLVTNLNTITVNGWYVHAPSPTGAPVAGVFGMLQHSGYLNNYFQRWQQLQTNTVYTRQWNTIDWSPWVPLAQVYIQSGDPGAVGAGALWITP